MRVKRVSNSASVGLLQLLELVDLASAYPGHAIASQKLREDRKTLDVPLDVFARLAKVPVTALVAVLNDRKGFRSAAAYEVVGDRLRSAATHRARVVDGTARPRPGTWR